jgi:glycosyltransferase involved in cell wall biosynthesis
MRLLFVENIANVSYNIGKRLREKGYDIQLLTRYNPKAGCLDLASNSRESWAKVIKISSFQDKTIKYLQAILSYDVDIIHVHYALEQASWALVARKVCRTRKVIVHCHGTDMRDISRTSRYGWLVRLNLKYADRVLVSTPDLLQHGAEFMPNPIDTDLFKPANPSIDLHQGHDYALFCPSRLIWKHKHQDWFLLALKKVLDLGYDCNLTLIEYGSDLEKTKALVKTLQLESNVAWVSPINPNAMPNYYNSCDIVWSQMGLGHLGLATLEALACNKPVLVDSFFDNAYSQLAPVDRVYTINDIVDHTWLALTTGHFVNNSRWWIKKHHSYEAVLARLEAVYQQLLLP